MSSDSDLVDITSVSVHRQMYDRCAANCLSDELADEYVYDDDDDYYDESPLAGGDNSASHHALVSSVVCTDASNIPSTNGIVEMQAQSSADRHCVPVTGKTMLQPPFGFPPRSQTEIVSRAMELLDSQVKPGPEDCVGNNNSFQHDNAECFKHAINSVCRHGNNDGTVQTAEAADTHGKVFTLYFEIRGRMHNTSHKLVRK